MALELLFSNKVNKIIINDYDKGIYYFWRAVILDIDKLVSKIRETEVTIDEWHKQKAIYLNNNRKYHL